MKLFDKTVKKNQPKKLIGISKVSILKRRNQIRSTIPTDLTYFKYVRYADDWIIGVYGPKSFALRLKNQIDPFLKTLKLELSIEKTLITNARRDRALFLGTTVKIHTSRNKNQTVLALNSKENPGDLPVVKYDLQLH